MTADNLCNEGLEFKGLILGILADDEINYKEGYQLLYWLEDHPEMANKHRTLFSKTKKFLEDDHLDTSEASVLKAVLENALKTEK